MNKTEFINELIETIDKELYQSTQTRYHCLNDDVIITDVGYVEDWWNEYKNVLRDRYCKNNASIKTNADKIRAMTDEDLANSVYIPCPYDDGGYGECKFGWHEQKQTCEVCKLEWLRMTTKDK